MKNNADKIDNVKIRPGLRSYLKYGYIPEDDKGEWLWGSVSTTLEYAYADWSFAQFCLALGKKEEYKKYYNRSLSYKNLYDSISCFMRPKNKNGSWYAPFNPDTLQGGDLDFTGAGGPGFVEGNAWHYHFFVPHDILGLKKLMGGSEIFVSKLQECFDKNNYNLWNEPDMAYPFLFDYIEGEGWRTQKEVRKQMELNFDITPQGIPGNDDCGTISAFYVFSAMGFYPACPTSDNYQLCSPIFDKVTISLNSNFYTGKKFIIETKNNGPDNIYIKTVKLNNNNYSTQQILHSDIVNGGRAIFEMTK